jgi:hypothetical protein
VQEENTEYYKCTKHAQKSALKLGQYLPADVRLPCMNSTMGLLNASWCSWPKNAMAGRTLSTTLILAAKLLSTRYFTKFLPMKPTPPSTNTLGFDILYIIIGAKRIYNKQSQLLLPPRKQNQRKGGLFCFTQACGPPIIFPFLS